MEIKRAFQDYQKVKEVLKSCNNEDQLRVGVRLVNLLDKKYPKEEIPHQYWETLKNITGLMRLKCGTENDEKINEISSIGKEFKIAAAATDDPELNQKIWVEEDSKETDEDILKEIHIGTQIEKNHCGEEEAGTLATQNVREIGDYYTNPEYAIIAIQNEGGDSQRTIRISKKEMERLHNDGNVGIDGVNLMYREEEEMEESTGAGSAGAYVGPMTREVVRRVIKKDIPVSVNGVVGKRKMNKPIGKIFSYGGTQNESEVLEEEDIEEATSYADAVGAYDTPGFAPSEFMGTAGKKGKARVNKGITHQKLAYPGGDFVKIKDRCARFPYCNQSPEAIKISKRPFKDAFYENKTIKKRNLKIKK
jgi:hypothetical protein